MGRIDKIFIDGLSILVVFENIVWSNSQGGTGCRINNCFYFRDDVNREFGSF